MPSAKPLSHFRDALRHHPIVVASTAATVGVLMGGFVAVQLLAPQQPRDGKTVQVAAEIKPKVTLAPAADTTVSSIASECDRQTWPNLSKTCMEEYRSKNRSARVIPLDKIDAAPATDAASSAEKPVIPAPPAPAVEAVQSVAAAPASVITEVKAPEPSRISPPAAQAVRVAIPAAEMSNEKQKAAKAKRKTNKPSAKPEADDDTATATAYADERDEDRVEKRRYDGRRRIVERWTERDYVVPNGDGRGQRRITVIHRNGGGLYESLFGD